MNAVQELRAGTIFEDQGQIFKVLSYEHIKTGRGSANIHVKVSNIRTGATVEKSFINSAKVQDISVSKKDIQYLYKDQDSAYFMNPLDFEQIPVPLKVIGDDSFYLKEGETYNVSFLEEEALSLNLPPKMDFEVLETAFGVKGNSATNVFKDAVLENGLTVKVPLFIKNGDKVRVDTRTGSYTERGQTPK